MREKAGMTWANRDLAVYNALAGEIDTAKAKLAEFVVGHPAVTLRQMRETLMFMAPPILARYVEGLRIAGLPE